MSCLGFDGADPVSLLQENQAVSPATTKGAYQVAALDERYSYLFGGWATSTEESGPRSAVFHMTSLACARGWAMSLYMTVMLEAIPASRPIPASGP